MQLNQERDAFIIELADNSQIREIKSLIFGILNEYGLRSDAQTDADLEDIEKHYFRRGGIFAIIKEENDILIGTLGLMPNSRNTAEIRKMYLRQEFRGKGLGKWMMKYVIDYAKSKGYKRLELETACNLREAILLYEKIGFKKYNRSGLSARCDSAYYLDI